MNLKEIGIKRDDSDVIKSYKSKFLNNQNEIYLDGNSLGKLPFKTIVDINNVVKKEWGNKLIGSWNDHWLDFTKKINLKMSKLINSSPDEVLIGESTSVNLYKIIYSILESNKFKKNLVTDMLNFPSDLYILDGLKELTLKKSILILEYDNYLECNIDILKKSFRQNPGIYCLSLVTYKSSYLYPMKELNQIAKKNNSIIIWDCSHAIGVCEIDVKKSETKVAIGCTYKYLNGGPGSPSFLYVSKDILKNIENPIKGWFGHLNPFDFSKKYISAKNIDKFNSGTPSILSLIPINNGLNITLEAGIVNIREKSINLGDYLITLINKKLVKHGVIMASPSDSKYRGSHVTIKHEEAWRICKILIKGGENKKKIIPDFRPNNNIRFGFAPLYTSFYDLYETIETIENILRSKEYLKIDNTKTVVP